MVTVLQDFQVSEEVDAEQPYPSWIRIAHRQRRRVK